MAFPNNLTEYLQESVDKYAFTIDGSIDAVVTTIAINGGTSSFKTPGIINLEDELIHYTGQNGTSLTGCIRGYGGTTAATHSGGATGYLPFTAEHYNEMITGITNVNKYLCRVLSSAPTSPVAYEIYANSSNGLVYIYNGSSWQVIGFITGTPDHDDLEELSTGDPHTAYYLEAELLSAHDGLAGGHVTGGDNHDHLDGVGFGRIDNLTDSPTKLDTPPSFDGEVVLDTATGTLWKGYDPGTGLEWQEVIGAPTTMIAMFDPANLSGSCPTGWSRYTPLDDRFAKGVTGGTAQATGGSQTHSHTYSATDIISHSHTVPAQSLTSISTFGHQHSLRVGNSGPVTGLYKEGSGGSISSDTNGSHNHTASATNDTELTGTVSPTTDSANGEPPHELVIWCQKD